MEIDPFLPKLTVALRKALGEPKICTEAFVLICQEVLPVFDHLGAVFHFAKVEFASKNDSLEKAAMKFLVLEDIVNADKQDGIVNQRGSCARNLHRLMSCIIFIKTLIRELARSPNVSLREAASVAYDTALAPIHTRIVRGIVMAGMPSTLPLLLELAGLMALPTRESFLTNIGETDESAQQAAGEVAQLVDELGVAITALYDAPMPASSVWSVSN